MGEGLYKLPQGWRWVRLGEVASKPQYGYTASATTEPKGPKFLRITDITTAEVDWRKVPYCEADEKVLAKYALNAGDILFARSGSIGATMVIKDTPPESAVFASYLLRVRLSEEVLPEYMGLLLKAPLCQSQLVPRGAAQRNINAKHIQQLFIPLPPLSEQRRIVARIEELMARVREAQRLRQQAREDAERLWQSVLAETFPRPGADLPEGWRWVRLGEVCEHLRSSIDPRRHPDEEFSLYSIPAYDSGMRPERVKGTQIGSTKLLVDGGVCLFSKLNPRIPRAWVVTNSDPSLRMLASTEFMPLKPIQPLLDLDFLGIVLITKTLLEQVTRDVSGATGSRQRLKPQVVLRALIPLPPLSEQRRIVAHLEEVRERIQALKKAQEETEARLKDLERSILDKAFRGEL